MRTPTGPRGKPPTSPPRTQEASWFGSAADLAEIEQRAQMVSLGPVPEHKQKGHVFAIVSAIVVLGLIGAGAYALGWFGGDNKPVEKPQPVATKDDLGAHPPVGQPTTPAPTTPPAESLPEISEVVIDSAPAGATIVALPDNTTVGKTPHTLTLLGSATVRHYKLVLAGHEELTLDVTPNKAKIELKPKLVRTGAAPKTNPRPVPVPAPPSTAPPSTAPVTKPESSMPVTKPDSPAPAPTPAPAPAPAEPPTAPATDGDESGEPAE
jgi:hypothetical protein